MFATLAAVVLLQTSPAPAPDPTFNAAARIREAVQVARTNAYRSAHVDWNALETEMTALSRDAADTADMLPAYALLTHSLGDGHSFIQPPRAVSAAWRDRHGDRDYRPATPSGRQVASAFHARSTVEHRDLINAPHRNIRLVVAPAFAGDARGERAEAYADALFTAVADAPDETCGYIIDLRGNVGGNFWPMITGLSGLLGDGPQGLFRDAEGQDSAYAALEDGRAVINEGENAGAVMAQAPVWRPADRLQAMPVAVLVDDATASSGEGVALAFVGRPDTRSFGGRTYGVASANNGFMLSDGVNLVLTVAMMVDPLGRTHPDGLTPDVVMDTGDDHPVEAAHAWLSALASCRD